MTFFEFDAGHDEKKETASLRPFLFLWLQRPERTFSVGFPLLEVVRSLVFFYFFSGLTSCSDVFGLAASSAAFGLFTEPSR